MHLPLLLVVVAALAGLCGAGAGAGGEGAGGAEDAFPGGQRTAVRGARGGAASLECRVRTRGSLAGATASWVRVRDAAVVAHGGAVFTADARVRAGVRALPGGDALHALRVAPLRAADAGAYECQLNTEPKRSLLFHLTVLDEPEPEVVVRAWGGAGARAEGAAGGAATLQCEARYSPPAPARAPGSAALDVLWLHAGAGAAGGDAPRPVALQEAGVSLETSRSEGGVRSRLTLRGLRARHAGRYTCAAAAGDGPPRASADVQLLVRGAPEHPLEAMQRDQAGAARGAGAGGGAARAPTTAPAAALAPLLLLHCTLCKLLL